MAYESIAAAEARIAELERETTRSTNEIMTHKKGYKQLKDFLEAKGLNVNEDLESQWEQTAGKSKTEAEATAKALTKMQKQMDDLTATNMQLAAEKTETTIRSTADQHAADIIGGKDYIELLIAKKKLKIEDGKLFQTEDGRDIPFETAIAAFKKNNPDRIKISQSNGGGSHSSSEQSQQKPLTIKRSELNKMSDKEKQDFFNKGGDLTAG